jgi:hypothetical protein
VRQLNEMWQKSTRSGNNGQCVEVRLNGEVIEVRNSNNPTAGVTRYTKGEWLAFIGGVKNNEFEV